MEGTPESARTRDDSHGNGGREACRSGDPPAREDDALTRLRIETPRVETLPTSSGTVTLRVDDIFFHSRYDPVREAQRIARETGESNVAVILSPGLGYLADHLHARRIILVERHPEIGAMRPDPRRLLAPDPAEIVQLIESIPGWEEGRLTILTGVHLDEDRDYYEAIRAALEDLIDRTAESKSTILAFRDLWEANLSGNAQFIRAAGRDKDIHWLPELRNLFDGATVVILAAGPTLEEDLPPLAAASSSALLLVAVDSALPLALAHGIQPDLCITIDPQPVKVRSLAGLGEIPLLASVLSPPGALQTAKKLYLFAQGHPSEGTFPMPRDAVVEEIGGSVATAAAVIAIRLGARRIVLIGQDLAILDQRFHARGSHHETSRYNGLSRFRSVEQHQARDFARRKIRLVPAVVGGTVPTTPAMDSYRRFFGDLARAHPEVEMIQTSRRGARIACTHIPLPELLEMLSGSADKDI